MHKTDRALLCPNPLQGVPQGAACEFRRSAPEAFAVQFDACLRLLKRAQAALQKCFGLLGEDIGRLPGQPA